MIKYPVLLFTLLLCACSMGTGRYQPQFFPDSFVGLLSGTVEDYHSTQLDYDLTSPDRQNLHFTHCRQVDTAKDEDVLASEYHLLMMLRANCKALNMYTKAGGAKYSYLGDMLTEAGVKALPATAYPYVNAEDKAKRKNKTLSEHHAVLVSDTLPDGSIYIETEEDTVIYQRLATGDFNGDSIEDALVRIDWRVNNAFGKGSKLILLTKKSIDEGFTELML